MGEFNLTRRDKFLILHVLMGVIFTSIPSVVKYYGLFVALYGVVRIVKSRNTGYDSAHFFVAYLVGLEIVTRMTRSTFITEFGKFALVCLFFVAIQVETKRTKPNFPIIFYILAMTPSIFLVPGANLMGTYYNSSFELFTFNMSGPIALAMSAFYFYKRKMNLVELKEMSYWLLLPIITAVVYIFIKAAGTTVDYSLSANSEESGGFGPNQVSTAIGMGILLIGLSLVYNYKLTFSKYFDLFLLSVFIYRCFLTFSRGGLITPILAFVCMILLVSTSAKSSTNRWRLIFLTLVMSVIVFIVYQRVQNKTGGLIERRFKGENGNTQYDGSKSYVDGRDVLFLADIEVFLDHPILGVGPGLAQQERVQRGAFNAAAHTEFSRMISEHGSFGIIALLILIITPISEYLKQKNLYNKAFVIGPIIFAMLTMSHSAMRLTAASFFYGLAFIELELVFPIRRVKKVNDNTVRQQITPTR